jgi:hypothetical protein
VVLPGGLGIDLELRGGGPVAVGADGGDATGLDQLLRVASAGLDIEAQIVGAFAFFVERLGGRLLLRRLRELLLRLGL